MKLNSRINHSKRKGRRTRSASYYFSLYELRRYKVNCAYVSLKNKSITFRAICPLVPRINILVKFKTPFPIF